MIPLVMSRTGSFAFVAATFARAGSGISAGGARSAAEQSATAVASGRRANGDLDVRAEVIPLPFPRGGDACGPLSVKIVPITIRIAGPDEADERIDVGLDRNGAVVVHAPEDHVEVLAGVCWSATSVIGCCPLK